MPPKTFVCRNLHKTIGSWKPSSCTTQWREIHSSFLVTTSYRLDLEPMLIEKQESVYTRRWVKQMTGSNQIKDSRLSRLILRHFFYLNKTKCHSSRAHICLQVECVSISFVSLGQCVCSFFFFVCFTSSNRRYPSLHRHRMLSILRSAQRNIRFWNGERGGGGL